MKVYNQTQDAEIEKARILFLKHFKDQAFLDLINNVEKFNHTDHSSEMVAAKILHYSGEVYLKHYRPFNPFTGAIAYAQDKNIYFNSRKNFPVMDRVETIAHECLHLMGYSHDGNYVTKYNLDSVPYKAAAIFVKYVRGLHE